MIALVAAASIAVFLIAFWALRVVPVARRVGGVAHEAVWAMRNPAMTDDAREVAVRRASLQLLGAFFSIGLRSTAALGAAALPILVADRLGIASDGDVIAFLSRWDVILAASALAVAAYYTGSRTRRPK